MEEHNETTAEHEESASEAIYTVKESAAASQVASPGPSGKRTWRINGWHLACAALLLLLFIYLGNRANDEDRWSDWGFGDAQTLLSLKQWQENGWVANYLLFIPQGYAKVVKILDDPQLRQHAHGTCPGSSPRVGPRLWYTHYPAGYLVPYAAMFATGLQSKFAAQMLSIFLSLAALALMYAVFARITSPAVAFFAVFFYSVSRPFLGFADTLANQPLDDLLRFAFMLAVVLSTRGETEIYRRRWMIVAWFLEFALSLSSFDSVFFIFTWLVGWDLLERRGFRWKIWFIYGMAPVTAHGLQFLQNVWYLGFNDAVIDIKDAFLLKNGADTNYNYGENRLSVIKGSLRIVFFGIINNTKLIWAMLIAYLAHAILLKERGDKSLPTAGLLWLLFFAGLSFVLVLPHAARMPYESRQMLPLVALLVSGLLVATGKTMLALIPHGPANTNGPGIFRKVFSILFLLAAVTILGYSGKVYLASDRNPLYPKQIGLMADAQFAKEIRNNLKTTYEPVIFDIGAFQMFWDPKYVAGYPQILPLTEYYAGSRPILCFNTPEGLTKDLVYMLQKSPYRFSPVLTATDQTMLRMVLEMLQLSGVLNDNQAKLYFVMDRYLVDLTDKLRWNSP